MTRPLACLGDKTTYGQILSATATWYEGDKPLVQSGDLARCDKCNGTFPIVGTAVDWTEEQPYVATGDRVACGCPDHVVYGSTTQFTTSPVSTRSTAARSANVAERPLPTRQPTPPPKPQPRCQPGYSLAPASARPNPPALRNRSITSARLRSSRRPQAKRQREQRWQAWRSIASPPAECCKVWDRGRFAASEPRHRPSPARPTHYCWHCGHPIWLTGPSTPKNNCAR